MTRRRLALPALVILALHAPVEAAPPRGTPVFIRLPPDALAVATGANGFVTVGSPTHLDDTSSEFCDPFGFCQGWLNQFELLGGVVVGF